MKLSIVICLYNTDKALLRECLSSVFNNTVIYRETVELCIVDDGSSVDYSEVISGYQKYLSINYVKTENRGIFLARQLGVEMATGDCIAFMDSDDSVSFNYYLPMLRSLEREGADIALNSWAFHTERARYYCKSYLDKITEPLVGEQPFSLFLSQEGKDQSLFVLWNKVYRADLIRLAIKRASEAIGERESFNYSEDALINFFAHLSCKKMTIERSGYYFYRSHPSQIVNVVSEERLRSQIEGMSLTFDIMEKHLPKVDGYMKNLCAWRELMARSHYSHARAEGYRELYPIIKERYGVNKLCRARLSDGECYSRNVVLGDNFAQVDNMLSNLLKIGESKNVSYDQTDDYVCRSVEFITREGVRLDYVNGAKTVIPKQKVSFKIRFLHNYYVYTLGMIVFPKGSKIRAFLKKHI